MSVGRRFVLDANVLIEAHRRYYAFDVCPGFWHALLRQHAAKRIESIDRIKLELVRPKTKEGDDNSEGEDRLSNWVRMEAPSTFFKGTVEKTVQEAFATIMNWVEDEARFTPEAKAKFASAADGWVVAYAKAIGLVVVTHEKSEPDSKRDVKIPNMCERIGVPFCDTFAMLRELKEQFVSG